MIQQALDRLAQGRTTLILAHRLSSVIGADRILVLDHGRVVESGRHAELIRRDGPYRRLMGAQAEERGDDLDLATEEFAATRGEPARTDYGEEAPAAIAPPRPRRSARLATLATLVGIIAPWRRRFAIVVDLRDRPGRGVYRRRHRRRAGGRRGQDRSAVRAIC